MRTLALLLAFSLASAALVLATPGASATCDPVNVTEEPLCLVDFLLGECIVNPLWHVDPQQPSRICWA